MPQYWFGLFQKWKVATFVFGFFGIVLAAPYTGDPTWDYVDAAFMAAFAYTTAPSATGVLYRAMRGRAPWYTTYTAVCVWMFSVSWSYDIYLLWRDGHYPLTWWSNIIASSILYLLAGMFWNLEEVEGRGVVFGFMMPEWPNIEASAQFNSRILIIALPIMIVVSAIIGSFLI